MVIHYNQLVREYEENLCNDLRGFLPGPGFLETWVHDCSHTKSILGIFDAAIEANMDTLTVQVDRETSQELDLEYLKKELSRYGVLEHRALNGQMELRFRRFNSEVIHSALQSEPGSAYLGCVTERLKKISKEGKVGHRVGALVLSASRDGVTLECLVETKGLVLEARHHGATGALRGVLDPFCALLEARPLQEGSNHSVIRLERTLRDPNHPPVVPGVLTPENADPIFRIPTELIRKIHREFLSGTGVEEKRNVWIDPLPAFWLLISPDEKIGRIQSAIDCCKPKLGLQDSQIRVIEVLNHSRAVLEITQAPGKRNAAFEQIKLERMVKQILNVPVELQSESLEDKNKRVARTRKEERIH